MIMSLFGQTLEKYTFCKGIHIYILQTQQNYTSVVVIVPFDAQKKAHNDMKFVYYN